MSVETVSTNNLEVDYLISDDEVPRCTPEVLADTRLTEDAVSDYLHKINKGPLLTAEQEVELAKDIEAGQMAEHAGEYLEIADRLGMTAEETEELIARGHAAMNELVEKNLRLVVANVKQYTGKGLSFMDLIQEGNDGLVHAAKMFDYRKGYKFSTYATCWIKQRARLALANQSRTIRLSKGVSDQVVKLAAARRNMEMELGRQPTLLELSAKLELPAERLMDLDEWSQRPISLDKPGQATDNQGEASAGMAEAIYDDGTPDVESTICYRDNLRQLEELITSTLTGRDADIVRMRYGLGTGSPMSTAQIGKQFDLSGVTIRNRLYKCMTELREAATASRLVEPI